MPQAACEPVANQRGVVRTINRQTDSGKLHGFRQDKMIILPLNQEHTLLEDTRDTCPNQNSKQQTPKQTHNKTSRSIGPHVQGAHASLRDRHSPSLGWGLQ